MSAAIITALDRESRPNITSVSLALATIGNDSSAQSLPTRAKKMAGLASPTQDPKAAPNASKKIGEDGQEYYLFAHLSRNDKTEMSYDHRLFQQVDFFVGEQWKPRCPREYKMKRQLRFLTVTLRKAMDKKDGQLWPLEKRAAYFGKLDPSYLHLLGCLRSKSGKYTYS